MDSVKTSFLSTALIKQVNFLFRFSRYTCKYLHVTVIAVNDDVNKALNVLGFFGTKTHQAVQTNRFFALSVWYVICIGQTISKTN